MNQENRPVWDQSTVYSGFDDSQIEADIAAVSQAISHFQEKSNWFSKWEEASDLMPIKNELVELSRVNLDTYTTVGTLLTFAYLKLSTDALHKEAKDLYQKVISLNAKFSQATKPIDLILLKSSDDFLEEFLKDERVREMSFALKYQRTQNEFLLSKPEEIMAKGLGENGLDAFGRLYDDLTGTMKLMVKGEEIGLAEASSLLRQGDRLTRELAYRSIQGKFAENEIVYATILNSITGWRNEMFQLRSQKRTLQPLDQAAHQSRISRETLETLMTTTYASRSIGQRALRGMAKVLEVPKLSPWDLLAPMPTDGAQSKTVDYSEGFELIAEAFGSFSPEMGEFALMMNRKGWIDARPSENRSQGAFCAGFARQREPRVFMTYQGSLGDVMTLAHELGHAYHSWVMRDLAPTQTHYPMTLAETASIFAETLVRDHLLTKAKNKTDKMKILWQEAGSASAFLINIPARYQFEKTMVEQRQTKSLEASALKSFMKSAWNEWYGDTLTETDEYFWATKLHFSMSRISFYNFPYLFGYLFSLGLYSKKDQYGADFPDLYRRLLRDTGVMSAEDLIQKYFQEDISKPKFWQGSLDVVERTISSFERELH